MMLGEMTLETVRTNVNGIRTWTFLTENNIEVGKYVRKGESDDKTDYFMLGIADVTTLISLHRRNKSNQKET